MCGIIGYTGSSNALPILTEGLRALEYRGYDSAGIAYFEKNTLKAVKSEGRIDALERKIDPAAKSDCGIGHTRWATHGAPSDRNSHPHGNESVYIVHNGIIENYIELREELHSLGYEFLSETDTEAAALLIDHYYKALSDPVLALREAAKRFRGSYAIAAVFADSPHVIYGIKKDNPMLIAVGSDGNFITSDISATLSYTDKFLRINDGEAVEVRDDFVLIYDEKGERVERELEKALWSRAEAEKGGFAHFMLKEIHEEPDAVIKTLRPNLNSSLPSFPSDLLSEKALRGYRHIHIVACGTAYHAGLIGAFAIERLARLRVSVSLASEFRYNSPILSSDDLVIIISQSGETADTLAALRLAKSEGAKVLGIVNVAGSSADRESDEVIHTLCGPEIAVASTKAFSVQLSLLYLIAIHMGLTLGKITEEKAKALTDELFHNIPRKISEVIKQSDSLKEAALCYKEAHSIFFIGRGIDALLSYEAALKCKEISYIHCEAYAAGELKHGTISLVTEGTPVIAIMNDPDTADKMISNIREVTSRGGDLLVIARENMPMPEELKSRAVTLPETEPLLSAMLSATAVQLLAYHLSNELGIDVDKPRNLAKSVTVE